MVEIDRCALAHGDESGYCSWCGVLLPLSRRRWCSDACSRAWSVNHYWTNARAEALSRDGHRCTECGDVEDLDVHHIEPVGARGYRPGCQHHQSNLVALCVAHHRAAHRALRAKDGEQLSLLGSAA